MEGNLDTTNTLLGILAAVAVLEAIALIGALVAGWMLVRRLMAALDEVRQHVPRLAERVDGLTAKVDAVLSDVKDVSARTAATAERVHHGFDVAGDMASTAMSSAQLFLGRKANIAASVLRGLRVAYHVLTHDTGPRQKTRPAPVPDDAGPRPEAEDRYHGSSAAERSDSTTAKEAAHGS